MTAAGSLLLAYAIGCLSFALAVGRLHGVDLRAHGSGNPGATNVGRVVGSGWGRAVLLADVAKGLVPVLVLRAPAGDLGLAALTPDLVDPEGRTLVAAAAVLGHVAPVWAGFRGGKGVATLVGAFLALDPLLAGMSVAAHVVVKRGLGYVSVASVALAWAFPVGQWMVRLLDTSSRFVDGMAVLAALAVLVTLRHRDNFRRIRAGSEDRYDEAPEPDAGRVSAPVPPPRDAEPSS